MTKFSNKSQKADSQNSYCLFFLLLSFMGDFAQLLEEQFCD